MSQEMFRMFELAQQGFACSQILLIMGLEAQGKSNTELVRAMTGLAGGMGFSGDTCGALTGGACLMGLFAGKGSPEEQAHDEFDLMVSELVDWFKQRMGEEFGGITCGAILGDDLPYKAVSVGCGNIVSATYDKAKEIMLKYGIVPAEAKA
ncbi:DVU_1555 family C-GCAxxG-C-C protein [Desulforamulus hydrothermalis]|uniref:C_GCAxxG_C_C family protein n=1 Tax=Desulforamulus hydrothermalis Lam5 = DSM 18033 TaxID=1121428 RepID=K8E0Q3_9FIRM|nr:DV_1555 family C-GCAxxG-C-C protein [Desulforamulus hydrothermalis]CCO09204.1 C_GCAxxG_C_C family protein [Desulforamulus hydrothermalis Lam5 = DSM 18033]SHH10711.1 C_GCAxxG_C_C family probable redox protein [Desulforamulus hydrothermalis Lam5 = DSM 18033]